jgi:hypothetical protein
LYRLQQGHSEHFRTTSSRKRGIVPFTHSILVVAKRTADSDELLDAMRSRATEHPARFTLLVPAPAPGPAGRAEAQGTVERALARLRAAGLDVEGGVGHPDPIDAVSDAWDPRRFDAVIVSTLPGAASKWLRYDVPQRIARVTGAPVTHVVASDRRAPAHSLPPAHERPGILAPLRVLTWGGAPADTGSLGAATRRGAGTGRRRTGLRGRA